MIFRNIDESKSQFFVYFCAKMLFLSNINTIINPNLRCLHLKILSEFDH